MAKSNKLIKLGHPSCYYINMKIKQISKPSFEFTNQIPNFSPKDILVAEDTSSAKKAGIISRQISKATSETWNTKTDNGQLSSLREESISLQETAKAKSKIPKLHGRNYGRSLTLEIEDDTVPFLSSKWILILLIIGIGLGAIGLIMFSHQNVVKLKEKPTKAIRSGKNRKVSK